MCPGHQLTPSTPEKEMRALCSLPGTQPSSRKEESSAMRRKGKAGCCESTDIQLSLTPQGTSAGAQGTGCGGGVRDVQAGRRRYPCMQVVCPNFSDERLAWVSWCVRAPSRPVWRPTPGISIEAYLESRAREKAFIQNERESPRPAGAAGDPGQKTKRR